MGSAVQTGLAGTGDGTGAVQQTDRHAGTARFPAAAAAALSITSPAAENSGRRLKPAADELSVQSPRLTATQEMVASKKSREDR